MKHRTLVVLTSLMLISGISVSNPTSASTGPALQVAEETMAAALSCPASFSGAHDPVLFVHGTTLTAESNWSWNYAKTLPAQGYDVCLVDLPDRARADIQESTEYVVSAIRTMAARSANGQVDVVGFSQGPLEQRWAVKWWPDVRAQVDDLVAMAGAAHGVTQADFTCSRKSCIPPIWQMKPDSQFLAALNAGDQTPGDVDYTSVYSRTDQIVWRRDAGGNPWDDSARVDGASNIAVQDVCPGRYVEHVQMVYDAVVYAAVFDALAHEGGADPSRIDQAVCLQRAMPGVDNGEAMTRSAEITRDLLMLTRDHHTDSEPPLAAYARS
jgi:triacylglycerol esterase/lipase EstA (alpha/beta hydrolase family)